METEIVNLLTVAIVHNTDLGRYTIARKKIPSSIKVLSKHLNRLIIRYKDKIYRVKFRDFSAKQREVMNFENDLILDYSFQFSVVALEKKETKSIKEVK